MSALPSIPPKISPDFLGGKGKNRRHQFDQGHQDLVKGCLGGFPFDRMCSRDVKPIFQDIQIEGAHIHGTKIIDTMVDDMELEPLIGIQGPGNQVL